MSHRLQHKHALLTGAAGGIGLAVAEAYAAQGAHCTVADLPGSAPAELQALMARFPDRVRYVPTNVTQMDEIDACVQAAAQAFGPITTLFNNAAIFDMAPLLESDPELATDPELRLALGIAYKALGRLQQAEEQFRAYGRLTGKKPF